jgi:predicted permease
MSENLREVLGQIRSLFRRRRMDREMAEELEFHRAMLSERLLREGTPAPQVGRETRRAFGDERRWHERLREVWQIRRLENLSRDVSFSVRLLWKSPGFTAVALLTLALGVGANTTIFSLINGLLLRPLPVPEADRLVVLRMEQGGPDPQYTFPSPFFRGLEKKRELFESVIAFDFSKLQVHTRSGVEVVEGQLVSGNLFAALRTQPLLGRVLTDKDDQTGGNPAGLAAVISEQFWERWFARTPDVIGRKLQVANTIFTVVGVTPKTFRGADPMQQPEIFLPLASETILDAPRSLTEAGHHAWWLTVMARLQPGVSLAQVNAALLPASMPILHDTVPDAAWIARAEKNHFKFSAEPGSRGFTYLRYFFRKPLVAVFAMCGGILLLACLNLASLLMARSAARERELATRMALGASRKRLIQQLLVESLLVAVAGSVLGLAIAPVVSTSLAAMLMGNNSRGAVHIDTSLDIRVFAFATITTMLAAALIGLLPALRATSGNLNEQIKEGQHPTRAADRRSLLPRVMLASEVSLALMLVVGAGLLATSLVRLYRSGAGFDPQGIVNIEFSIDKQTLEGDPLYRLYQQIVEGLSRQPGVKSVSVAWIVPMTHFTWDDDHSVPGGTGHDLYLNAVGPAYFQTMRIPMYSGRDFRWDDNSQTSDKVILNQSAAKLFFGAQNPIGQRILREPKKKPFEVVAVVGDAKYEDMRQPAPPAAYVPFMQSEEGKNSYHAVIRMDGPAAPMAAAARSLAARLAPDIPPPVMETMESVVDESLSTERVMALLAVFFAGCALLVTAIGLYGTLAYNTARRTTEIGIRMALGAQRRAVVSLIFRENAWIAAMGCGAGLLVALLGSRVLSSFLYGTSPHDPWILAGGVAAMGMIACAASLLPALRAARIEPMAAIRCE